MARYIDADKIFYRERMTVFYNSKPIKEDIAFKQDIEDVQTEDVAPVVHAHWKFGKCTKCGGDAPFWSMASTYRASSYCPDCGAKMDEEV